MRLSRATDAVPARPAERMDRESWLEAALSALAEGGVQQVRVEVLAKTLGVTKGSFYWHFSDRDALLAVLLARWRDGRVAAIHAQAEAGGGTPRAQLHRMLDLYLDRANPRGMAIELAMRDWARRDAAAASAVGAVDAARLATLERLFAAMGHARREAAARALALYAVIFGQSLIAAGKTAAKEHDLRERCAQLLIG
ncbi:MAG TPA: TetR/AcrR family transcriptional regulator [Stellaceae bacterium]|nr:TetR/AcrR family transcriptional regulator [Stellaceae bacterium]